jgi:hypothetical protein
MCKTKFGVPYQKQVKESKVLDGEGIDSGQSTTCHNHLVLIL